MKSQMINIPSYIEDPAYRYKMARIVHKIEGKGNGIKTNLVNLVEIARDLRVRSEYPLKFMGYEKGSQTKYTVNKNEVQSIINGAFQEDELRELLDRFIEKYVLCKKCKYPEMSIKVVKNNVQGECAACGFKGELDNKHRLANFIIKNPPQNTGEFSLKNQQQNQVNNELNQIQIKKTIKKAKPGTFSAEKLSKNSDLMIRLIDKMNGFYKKLDAKRENEGMVDFEEFDEAVEFLSRKIIKMNLENNMEDRITFIIFNTVFDVNIARNIQKNKYLVNQIYKQFDISDSMFQAYTLVNLMHLLFQRFPEHDFVKFVPTICKLFMDSEIIFEQTFLQLIKLNEQLQDQMEQHFAFSEDNQQKFLESAKPFLDWLLDSNEEEEEYDEEEEEEQEDDEQIDDI